MTKTLKLVIPMLALTGAFVMSLRGADQGASLVGIVKTQSGEPAIGAFVRVKNNDRRLSVTVVSQDLGRYKVVNLPKGKYTVQSVGGGLQSESATVELDGKRVPKVDMVLTTPINYKGNVTIADMATLMPEGGAKDIIRGECTHCHLNGLEEIVVSRKSRDGWIETITKMENQPYGHENSLVMTPEKKEMVIDYLTRNFGPDLAPFDQDKLPKLWVRGAAAKSVVTEFFVTQGARPHDFDIDSKGIIWVGEISFGMLGRYDPQTATYTRIPLPEGTYPEPVAVDPNDRVWIGDGHYRHGSVNSRMMMYDPKTGKFTIYPIANPTHAQNPVLLVIRFHPDGSVLGDMYEGQILVRIDPATKKVTEISIPAKPLYGMAIDKNEAVWFSEQMNGKLARVAGSKGGQFTEFDLPTKDSMPQRMEADAEGNIWVPEYRASKLAMIDHRTAKIVEYPTPTHNSGPYSLIIDKTRNVIWVNEMMAGQIARFDQQTKAWTEYPLPTRLSSVRLIRLDPFHPNRIWFSGYLRDNVGYLDVSE